VAGFIPGVAEKEMIISLILIEELDVDLQFCDSSFACRSDRPRCQTCVFDTWLVRTGARENNTLSDLSLSIWKAEKSCQ
jgi:hypothetical protein